MPKALRLEIGLHLARFDSRVIMMFLTRFKPLVGSPLVHCLAGETCFNVLGIYWAISCFGWLQGIAYDAGILPTVAPFVAARLTFCGSGPGAGPGWAGGGHANRAGRRGPINTR